MKKGDLILLCMNDVALTLEKKKKAENDFTRKRRGYCFLVQTFTEITKKIIPNLFASLNN